MPYAPRTIDFNQYVHGDLCKHLGIDSSTDMHGDLCKHLGIDSSTDMIGTRVSI